MIRTLQDDAVKESGWVLLNRKYSEKHRKAICSGCQIKEEAKVERKQVFS
jgi:hypothetical protein